MLVTLTLERNIVSKYVQKYLGINPIIADVLEFSILSNDYEFLLQGRQK